MIYGIGVVVSWHDTALSEDLLRQLRLVIIVLSCSHNLAYFNTVLSCTLSLFSDTCCG